MNIARISGDDIIHSFQFRHVKALSRYNQMCVSDVKCVEGVHDFTASVLMSIELQQTIGYGQRATSDEVSINMVTRHDFI